MIIETAFVDSIAGDTAWVSAQRQSTCGACGVQQTCGTRVLSKVVGRKFARLEVRNSLQASPGDQVKIAIPEQALLKGAVAVYLVPLISFFLMAAVGTLMTEDYPDIAAMVMGLAGLGLGLKWVGRYERRRLGEAGFYAEIVAIDNMTNAVPGVAVQFKKLPSGE